MRAIAPASSPGVEREGAADEPFLRAVRARRRGGSRSRSPAACACAARPRGRWCAPTRRGSTSRRRSSRRSSPAPRPSFPARPPTTPRPAPPWRATKRARCGAGTPAPATTTSFAPAEARPTRMPVSAWCVKHDGAVETPVAHEQVAAQPDEEDRLAVGPRREERLQVLEVRGLEEELRACRPRASSRASPSARRGAVRRAGPAARRIASLMSMPSPPRFAPRACRAREFRRQARHRAGPHGDHDVAVADRREHRVLHLRHLLDEDRLHLARDAHGAHQRAAVRGDDRRLAAPGRRRRARARRRSRARARSPRRGRACA